jgi:hypothetical protein
MAVGIEDRDVGNTSPPGRHRRTGRLPRISRLRWWHEVLLIAIGYAIYTVIRNTVPRHTARAERNALDIERWERASGIFREHGVNNWLAAHHDLAVVANYWYATAHFAVTIGVAVWVLWKSPRHARPLRIAWYTTNVVALFGFYFYPLAPPRLMSGYIDTVEKLGIWGSWGKEGSPDGASNPFAAMPSMHIGWSVWCAIVVTVLARRWWVKVLAVAYPIITVFVIAGTANHYFLDGVGGLVALAVGFVTARIITGAWPFTPEEEPIAPRENPSTDISAAP